jgi:multidrug resistance efflux pump
MALRDVKEYYYTMLNQYVELKADLDDFNRALNNGYITEDKLAEVKADVLDAKANLERIQYILYLFNLPNRKKKRAKLQFADSALQKYFKEVGADLDSIKDENTNCLTHIKLELKKLQKEIKNSDERNHN